MKNPFAMPPFFHTPETVAQLGSVLNHPDGHQWLMDHYVTTYFQKTETRSIVEGFLDASKIWDCPFIKHSTVFRSDLLALHIDLIDFFRGLISQGFYVLLLINYYHVKDSTIYHKINAGHTVMLSGYDEKSKTFLLSDFSGMDNEYGFSQISEGELLEAAIFCDPVEFERNDSLYVDQFQKDYFECIQYFKVNHEIRYMFSKNILIRKLKAYLAGETPTQITYFPCGFEAENAAWGMQMRYSFLEYLDRATKRHYNWGNIRRFIFFLGTIRQLTELRIDYLNKNYVLKDGEYLKKRNKDLWNTQDILLKIVIKNGFRNYRINYKNVVDFYKLVERYFDEEKILLEDFISSLENKEQA